MLVDRDDEAARRCLTDRKKLAETLDLCMVGAMQVHPRLNPG